MIQVRARGSKEWYRPDRDYITVHPRLISRALQAITEDLQREAAESDCEDGIKVLGMMSTKLAILVNSCGDRKLTKEELIDQLHALENEFPYLSLRLANKMMHLSFELYRSWKMEMLPEKSDGTVDHSQVKPVEVQPTPAVEGPK